jgi:hypothetical protein
MQQVEIDATWIDQFLERCCLDVAVAACCAATDLRAGNPDCGRQWSPDGCARAGQTRMRVLESRKSYRRQLLRRRQCAVPAFIQVVILN